MEICPGCRNTHTLSSRRHNQTQRATDTHTYKCTGWTHRRNTQIHPRHIQPETHTWTLAHEFTPKETPCRERHRETQRYIQETTKDRGTPKQTETLPDRSLRTKTDEGGAIHNRVTILTMTRFKNSLSGSYDTIFTWFSSYFFAKFI